MLYFQKNAHWTHHCGAQGLMSDWLTERSSLTTRLQRCCQLFKVQRLYQKPMVCLPDEFLLCGLPAVQKVMEREVILRCDGQAVVYAHTIVPLTASASEWPLFASLGEKSLGTTLFNDPLVRRGALQFARLRNSHPLMQRIVQAGLISESNCHGKLVQGLFARRSVFMRKASPLLVTEVFLPEILNLRIR